MYKVKGDNILKKDIALKNYVKGTPESVVAMWLLIYDYQLYGFSREKYEIANLFSNNIKELPAFQALIKKMSAYMSLAKGNKFPIAEFSFCKRFWTDNRQFQIHAYRFLGIVLQALYQPISRLKNDLRRL